MAQFYKTSPRTSRTHPLQIAEIPSGPGMGRIGVTFAPGKIQSDAATGRWQRDLGADLDVVARWNAAAVLSLIEEHEIDALCISSLGREVVRRHMEWHHLPFADCSVPDKLFEARWSNAGEAIRGLLRAGFKVLIHCKGGLGRAGTIAARVLVEFGHTPNSAMEIVRAARPGAIETTEQKAWIAAGRQVPEARPSQDTSARLDRAVGSLLGLAVGDAIGTTLEFTSKPIAAEHFEMVGGGPFGLKAGEWTDDTSMALALADSLSHDSSLDPADLMARFLSWHRTGQYSCIGRCFDIGTTVRAALAQFERTGDPIAGSKDSYAAGNGALMRLAPVAIRHWDNLTECARIAALQTSTTHGAPEAVSASVLFATMLAEAIDGKPRSDVFRPRREPFDGRVTDIAQGSWRGKHRDSIRGSGYCVQSLEAAIWAVARTTSFRKAVLTAANLGEDADTTAAIAGQLAGAIYGVSGIPREWLERLACGQKIRTAADQLAKPAQ